MEEKLGVLGLLVISHIPSQIQYKAGFDSISSTLFMALMLSQAMVIAPDVLHNRSIGTVKEILFNKDEISMMGIYHSVSLCIIHNTVDPHG